MVTVRAYFPADAAREMPRAGNHLSWAAGGPLGGYADFSWYSAGPFGGMLIGVHT
jgi:hypothetical protein